MRRSAFSRAMVNQADTDARRRSLNLTLVTEMSRFMRKTERKVVEAVAFLQGGHAPRIWAFLQVAPLSIH